MNNPKLVHAIRETAQGLHRPDTTDEHRFPTSTGPRHLEWMIYMVTKHAEEWPPDKLGRWLGFIQGVLASREQLDVAKERDRTRPLFHAAYGDNAPPTLEKE